MNVGLKQWINTARIFKGYNIIIMNLGSTLKI